MVDQPTSPSPVSRPPWWLALLILSGLCALCVAASRLVPEGTPLWQPIGLAMLATILVLYGPEMLSKVLEAGSWIAGGGSHREDPSA